MGGGKQVRSLLMLCFFYWGGGGPVVVCFLVWGLCLLAGLR